MGFFSKTCAKTHLPVLAQYPWARIAPRLNRIVVLQPHEDPFEANYDGYGLHLSDYDEAKFVLLSDYAGETYAQLGKSHDEPQQGYFLDEAFVLELAKFPGFASYDAYEDVLSEFERQLDVVIEEELTRVGLAYEPDRGYKVSQLLWDLHESADRLQPVDLTHFPTLTGHTVEDLRTKAPLYIAARTARLATLAQQLLASHQAAGAAAT